MRAERENSKKFAESFAGKANYDVLLENPDCGNLKTPQLGHALDKGLLRAYKTRLPNDIHRILGWQLQDGIRK